jgi:hypothetical protein
MKLKTILLGMAFGVLAAGHALAADVTGRWAGDVKLPNGQTLPFIAELKQQGQAVTGKLAGINGAPDVQIMDGKIDNDRLTFWGARRMNNAEVRFDYVGAVKPDAIDFQIVRADGSQPPLSTRAVRAPGG